MGFFSILVLYKCCIENRRVRNEVGGGVRFRLLFKRFSCSIVMKGDFRIVIIWVRVCLKM